MALDFSQLKGALQMASKPFTPVHERDLRAWIDLSRWAPNDTTNRQLYYQGVMGSKKMYVLSTMEPMPPIPKSEGSGWYGVTDYRITVSMDGRFYEIRYESFQSADGLPGAKSTAQTASGATVRQYMGYTPTGIYEVERSPRINKVVHDYLWNALS